VTPQLGLALGLLIASSFVGVAASLTAMRMVDDVNAKLPPDGQFAQLGWHFVKARRLFKEYRRLYPSGPLIVREITLTAIGFGLFLVAAGLVMGPLAPVWLGICGGAAAWLTYRQ
jgi:hypothetical protein